MSGARSYHAGLAAEEIVCRHYEASGCVAVHRRWRGKSGEIDLVINQGDTVIFVEVKASASMDRAVQALSGRQLERLVSAAGEYLASQGAGLNTRARFDLAAVDNSGAVQIVSNITG